jgi:hypothetical protein
MPTQNNPPSQCPQGLKKYVAPLSAVIHAEQEYPKRLDERSRLAKMARAARLLVRELSDPVMLSRIAPGDQRWSKADREGQTVADLEGLPELIVQAGAGIRKGRGSHKDYVRPDGRAALTQCALFVVRWRFSQGRAAPATSLEVQGECEALWRRAGGKPHYNGLKKDPRRGVWRNPLRRAIERPDGETKPPK